MENYYFMSTPLIPPAPGMALLPTYHPSSAEGGTELGSGGRVQDAHVLHFGTAIDPFGLGRERKGDSPVGPFPLSPPLSKIHSLESRS